MFGRKKKIKVEINRVVHTLTVEDIKEIIRDLHACQRLLNEVSERAVSDRDEARWKINQLQDRLDAANAKLKDYGHPGA